MGPTKKPPHDRFLCPVGNLFIGSSSLRDHRPSANPGIGIEDDCGCGAAEPTYLWARLVSGARVDSAGGTLRPAPLPRFLFRKTGEQYCDYHGGYVLPGHLGIQAVAAGML